MSMNSAGTPLSRAADRRRLTLLSRESSLPNAVTVSGTFDDWSSSLHLNRLPSGKFAGKVKLPYDSKVLFKVSDPYTRFFKKLKHWPVHC
jgi:hypothetical protein